MTLRIAGVSRLLAAATMAVAVIVLVYGLELPARGAAPARRHPLRTPVGVVVGAVAEARWPRSATPARLLQLVTVAVASIWALEAFAYTLLTVWSRGGLLRRDPADGRRDASSAAGRLQIAGAIVVAHLLLAAGTLAATGELPDWGWYINTLRAFLFGQLGDWTYDFSPFSPGIAVRCPLHGQRLRARRDP